MSRNLARVIAIISILTLWIGALAGCPKKKSGGTNDTISAEAPIVLKDSSTGFLLTWIDDKGDFHVEQKAADVPLLGRDAVRVVDPEKDLGTHDDKVFVADLRNAQPDGTYAVR